MNDRDEKERFRKDFIPKNIRDAFLKATKQALKVSWILLKIFIPVSLLTAFLDQIGFLDLIAPIFKPLMDLMGLPGEAALVLLISWFNSLFAVVAAAGVLELTVRQITLIAIVTGFAHNLILETGIMMRLKMGRPAIAITRIVFSLLAGILLHRIMPEQIAGPAIASAQTAAAFSWSGLLIKVLLNSAQIVLMMFLIMLAYELILLWKQRKIIKKVFSKVIRFLGMSDAATIPWLVGTFVGIAYGAGIFFAINEKHLLSQKDKSLLALSLCLLHAVLEDTIVFVAIGANALWILGFRILILVIIMGIVGRGELYKKLLWLGLPKAENDLASS